MNWPNIIARIATYYTYQEIADLAGMSKGGVHNLLTGRAATVKYECGAALVDLHKRLLRKGRKS